MEWNLVEELLEEDFQLFCRVFGNTKREYCVTQNGIGISEDTPIRM